MLGTCAECLFYCASQTHSVKWHLYIFLLLPSVFYYIQGGSQEFRRVKEFGNPFFNIFFYFNTSFSSPFLLSFISESILGRHLHAFDWVPNKPKKLINKGFSLDDLLLGSYVLFLGSCFFSKKVLENECILA